MNDIFDIIVRWFSEDDVKDDSQINNLTTNNL